MKKIASMTLLLAAAVLLAACPKKPTVPEAPSAKTQVPSSATTAGASGASTTGNQFGDDTSAADAARARNVIYFDFDKSEIKPEFANVVTAAAKNLSNHPTLKVKLEGNTDERGTREYNIGLGERRAQAVRRALLLEGAAEGQITTVSFGAERPAVEGDNEDAWAKNRRVDFNYQAAAGQQ